jgi:hypothetical protein
MKIRMSASGAILPFSIHLLNRRSPPSAAHRTVKLIEF